MTLKRRDKIALQIAALVLLLVFQWSHGTFDRALYSLGLNAKDCGQNGHGAVFCGDQLKQYHQNLHDAAISP